MSLAGELCSYCFAPAEAWDHVHARSLGGADDTTNLVPACTACNSRKRDKSLLRFLWERAGHAWDVCRSIGTDDVRRLSKKARDAIADRDAAMLRANDLGHGVRLIAADAELKPATVARIIRKQRERS